MNYFISFFVFGICLVLMASGLIFAKKILQKGCSVDPDDCRCKREGKKPSEDCPDANNKN